MMKRRRLLITGVLLLLGGAIVNVAVAWGCSLWSPSPNYTMRKWEEIAPTQWGRRPPAHYDSTPSQVWRSDSFGITEIASLSVTRDDYTFDFQVMTYVGLPLRSMSIEYLDKGYEGAIQPARYDTWNGDSATVNAFRAPAGWSREQFDIRRDFLPYQTWWPGFAINTIFYAAMLWGGWVVFFVPGMVRRRIRRRRGLCPACAYPIGTSPVCTECGKAVNSKGAYPNVG